MSVSSAGWAVRRSANRRARSGRSGQHTEGCLLHADGEQHRSGLGAAVAASDVRCATTTRWQRRRTEPAAARQEARGRTGPASRAPTSSGGGRSRSVADGRGSGRLGTASSDVVAGHRRMKGGGGAPELVGQTPVRRKAETGCVEMVDDAVADHQAQVLLDQPSGRFERVDAKWIGGQGDVRPVLCEPRSGPCATSRHRPPRCRAARRTRPRGARREGGDVRPTPRTGVHPPAASPPAPAGTS